MEIIRVPINMKEIVEKHMTHFKTLTKAVVDIKKGLIALDGELHADLERLLIEDGSLQEDLWGINIYPHRKEEPVEYSALINVRPHQNNFSMEIEDHETRKKIGITIERLIKL